MLNTVSELLLKSYEKSPECHKLREKAITEDFESNVKDYEMAYKAVNNIADEYFKTGFKFGVALATEIIRKKDFHNKAR